MMEVKLGPFDSAAEACDYCFTSFTEHGVPPTIRERHAHARRSNWTSWFDSRSQAPRPLRKHIRPHTPRPSSQSPLPTVDTHRLRPPCLSLGSPSHRDLRRGQTGEGRRERGEEGEGKRTFLRYS